MRGTRLMSRPSICSGTRSIPRSLTMCKSNLLILGDLLLNMDDGQLDLVVCRHPLAGAGRHRLARQRIVERDAQGIVSGADIGWNCQTHRFAQDLARRPARSSQPVPERDLVDG